MRITSQDFRKKIYNKEHLPPGLIVKSNVHLSYHHYKHVTLLPDNLTIEGFLDLENCTSLTHLPSGLVVKGWLDLYGSIYLTHLPPGLVVKGWLGILNCNSLTNFPPDLKAGKIFCDKNLINTIHQEDLPLYINFNFAKNKDTYEYFTRRLHS
jgi:hypothetical protein